MRGLERLIATYRYSQDETRADRRSTQRRACDRLILLRALNLALPTEAKGKAWLLLHLERARKNGL